MNISAMIPLLFANRRVLAYDTFTRPDNASLGNLESGQQWNVLQGAAAIVSNAIKWTAYTSNNGLAVFDAGKSDVIVSADVTWQSSSYTRIALRMSDANNGFFAEIESGKTNLRRIQGGTTTIIGTFNHTTTNGAVYHYDIQAIGQQLAVFVNGQQVISVTDSFNQTATLMGLGRNNSLGSFNSIQDNIFVTEAA